MSASWEEKWGWVLEAWMGATAESIVQQSGAREGRVPLCMRCPARVRWLVKLEGRSGRVLNDRQTGMPSLTLLYSPAAGHMAERSLTEPVFCIDAAPAPVLVVRVPSERRLQYLIFAQVSQIRRGYVTHGPRCLWSNDQGPGIPLNIIVALRHSWWSWKLDSQHFKKAYWHRKVVPSIHLRVPIRLCTRISSSSLKPM